MFYPSKGERMQSNDPVPVIVLCILTTSHVWGWDAKNIPPFAKKHCKMNDGIPLKTLKTQLDRQMDHLRLGFWITCE